MNDLFQLLFKLLFPTSWLLKVPDEARISRRFRWRSTHQQPRDVTCLMAGHQCRGARPLLPALPAVSWGVFPFP